MPVLSSYSEFRHYFATSSTIDADGYEVWPVAQLRASGFDGGFRGLPTGAPTQSFTFPVQLSVSDTAAGAPAHRVYLSQRTDDAALQYFSVLESSILTGTWSLQLTSFGLTELGTATISTQALLDKALRDVHFYVQRLSDDAIQWIDVYATVQTPT